MQKLPIFEDEQLVEHIRLRDLNKLVCWMDNHPRMWARIGNLAARGIHDPEEVTEMLQELLNHGFYQIFVLTVNIVCLDTRIKEYLLDNVLDKQKGRLSEEVAYAVGFLIMDRIEQYEEEYKDIHSEAAQLHTNRNQ